MKKIVIIEDDTDICNMITKFLSDHSYEVCSATNGKEGVDLCQNFFSRPYHFRLNASNFKRR